MLEYLPVEYFSTLLPLAGLCVCLSGLYALCTPYKLIRYELRYMAGTVLLAFLLVFMGCFFMGAFNDPQMQQLFHLESVKISSGAIIMMPIPVGLICFSALFIAGGKRVQNDIELESIYTGDMTVMIGWFMAVFALVATVSFIGVLFAP